MKNASYYGRLILTKYIRIFRVLHPRWQGIGCILKIQIRIDLLPTSFQCVHYRYYVRSHYEKKWM